MKSRVSTVVCRKLLRLPPSQRERIIRWAAPHFDKFKAYLPAVIVDSFNGLRQAVDQHDEAAK